jgi:hypothetical protein
LRIDDETASAARRALEAGFEFDQQLGLELQEVAAP